MCKVPLELLSFILHLVEGLSESVGGILDFTLCLEGTHFLLEHVGELNEVPVLDSELPYLCVVEIDPPCLVAFDNGSKIEVYESKTCGKLLKLFV